ncbi:MAG TPA: hypothetical protein VMH83_02740 [Candidatus Acidoferrum sp.]|nr:hypothetical protein [Candidatus Acidoferrum sp.]
MYRPIAVLLCALIAPVVCSTPLPATGAFVFSSLCSGEEDAGGDKVVLIRGPEGNSAVYWRTEGPILAPLLAFGPDVEIDDQHGTISMHFVDPDFPGDAGKYELKGSVTAEELKLSSNVAGDIHLPRRLREDGKLPKCGH